MHIFDGGWFLGMHLFWWLFWIALIALLIMFVVPPSRDRMRETPLERLQRRYADGEISTEEYEERRRRIEQDRPKP